MNVIEYSDKASDLLLKELYKVTTDPKLKELLYSYKDIEKTVDINWSIISTALLISENLSHGMTAYGKLHDNTVRLLIDNWVVDGDDYEEYSTNYALNCALTEDNYDCISMKYIFDYCENPKEYQKNFSEEWANSTYEDTQEQDDEDYEYEGYDYEYYLDDNSPVLRRINFGKYDDIYCMYFGEKTTNPNIQHNYSFKNPNTKEITPCIEGALDENNKFDLSKFVFRVRCAIAHSECEYYNNYIRLYHNRSDGTKDFNVTIDKKSLMYIIDDLAETAHKRNQKDDDIDIFNSSINFNRRLDELLYKFPASNTEKVLSDDEILEAFKSFKYSNESDIIKAINKSKEEMKDWDDPILAPEEYDAIVFDNEEEEKAYEYQLKNDIKIYTVFSNLPKQNKNVLIEIGTVLNYYLYSNKDGSIGDEHDAKINFYSYLSSNDYKTQYTIGKDDIYKGELSKILLLSYLNCVLCNNYNYSLNENNLYDEIDVNFPNMRVDIAIKNSFNARLIEKNNNLIKEANIRLLSLKRTYKRINQSRRKNKEALKNNKIDNDYYNNKMPSIIEYQVNRLKDTIETIKETKRKIEELSTMSSEKEKTAFIVKSIRNSIAHGNVFFGKDNINSNTYVNFKDYDENNNLTFRGRIKVEDLLKTLIDNKSKFFKKTVEEQPKTK